jgi:hypothetical protein
MNHPFEWPGACARSPMPHRADCFDLSDLCRDVGLFLDLGDPGELQAGATIGGERLCLLHDEDLDDGVYLFIDVGAVPGDADAASTLRALLDVNLELSPQHGESFGIDGRSGRILFRAFMRGGDFTPRMIARRIGLYVGLMQELRQGPLRFLPPA